MKTLKNILAVVIGLIIGGTVNMFIIINSASIIQPPTGSDLTSMEGLQSAMLLMEPKHFLLPFMAHALGTFVGALIATSIAADNKMRFAMIIGILFLIGGFWNIVVLPSPIWFTLADLLLAYIPMAYIGGKFVLKKKRSKL